MIKKKETGKGGTEWRDKEERRMGEEKRETRGMKWRMGKRRWGKEEDGKRERSE